MNVLKLVAIVLIGVGALALVYDTFSYTKDTHDVKIGDLVEVSVRETQTVNIPVWGGIGAIAVGTLLLFMRRKSPT